MSLTVRASVMDDLPRILDTYREARAIMKASGNPNQWGDNRPEASVIEADITAHHSFVVVNEKQTICGVFAYFRNWDDPTYHEIEGAWLNTEPYSVVHRIASNGQAHGVLSAMLAYAEDGNRNIRVDTHRDNRIMQHLLEKYGYVRCGTIITDDGTPRLAYMKTRKES